MYIVSFVIGGVHSTPIGRRRPYAGVVYIMPMSYDKYIIIIMAKVAIMAHCLGLAD